MDTDELAIPLLNWSYLALANSANWAGDYLHYL